MMTAEPTRRPLTVLQSFPVPLPTTNPYVIMLAESVRAVDGVEVQNFSWRAALGNRYDVFHAHWPEILVDGRNPLRKAVRQLLFLTFLLRLKLTRTAIVRTVHNLELPQGISRREVWLLRLFERWTTLRITLNDATVLPAGQPFERIVHGHYRDWFADFDKPAPVPGRIAFFGLIRRYKRVDLLIRAFAELPAGNSSVSLRVAGRPSTPELVDELRRLAGTDSRIEFSFAFLDDSELVSEVGEAELIVLPYPEMHNSGGALTALSLGRPVLMTDNAANRRLRDEVGPAWVMLYPGELTGAHLTDALRAARELDIEAQPDLSARNWPESGRAHVAAYRRAVDLLRRRHLS